MKIYVASSWRNLLQPAVVICLQKCGHDVYDFRNPAPGNKGLWSQIDENWKDWTVEQYREALNHPIAIAGHDLDITALRNCDACILVLPSGRSASWEFGYAMAQGKDAAVLALEPVEPDLMYRGAKILASMNELFDAYGNGI